MSRRGDQAGRLAPWGRGHRSAPSRSLLRWLFGFVALLWFADNSWAETSLRVTGVVVSSSGEPVRGTVLALPQGVVDGGGDTARSSRRGAVQVTSDGSFDLEVPEAGLWQIQVESVDGRLASRNLGWVERNVGNVRIDLPDLESLVVKVVDAVGDAVPDAELWLTAGASTLQRGGTRMVVRGRTDPQGLIRLPSPTGAPMTDAPVLVGAVQTPLPSFSTLRPEMQEVVDDSLIVVRLEAVREIRVGIRLDGRKSSGAVLRLRDAPGLPPVQTDESGTLRLWVPRAGVVDDGEPVEPWLVEVPGGSRPLRVARPPAPNKPGDDGVEWLVDLKTAPCDGRVEDRGGRPVAGATVWADSGDWVRSREDGTFCLPSVRLVGEDPEGLSDASSLHVDAPGWGRREATWGARASIVLEREPVLRVRAVDERGAPVAGAQVRIHPLNWARMRGASHSRLAEEWVAADTDDTGRAELFVERRSYDVEVHKPGRRRWLDRVAEFPEEWATHEIVAELPRGSVQEGWVVDDRDQPIEGAEVLLVRDGDLSTLKRSNLVPQPVATAVTDTEGRFEFRDQAPGVFTLAAFARGYVGGMVRGVQIGAADEALGTVILVEASDLEGRVVNPQGLPVAGVSIYVSDAAEPEPLRNWRTQAGTKTDLDGRFRREDLGPGERRLVFRHRDFVQKEMVVDLPVEDALEVVLTEGLILPVQVAFSDGSSPATAEIKAMETARTPAGSVSEKLPGGVGTLRRLHPGRYWFEVTGDHSAPVEFDGRVDAEANVVDLPADAPARYDGERLVVTLPDGVTVEGVVRDPEGSLVPGSTVSVGRQWVRAEEGAFTLAHVPRGESGLRVRANGFAEHQQRLQLDGDVVLEIQLDRGATLTGQVLDPRGTPLTEATVELKRTDGGYLSRPAQARTDENGRYRIEGIREESVLLRAHAMGWSEHGPLQLELQPGETFYDIELARGVRLFGQVTGLPDELVGRATLQLGVFNASGRSRTSPIRQDGSYEFLGVTPGIARLALQEGRGVPDQVRTVTIPDQPEYRYDFEIGAGRLTGVVLEDGQPVPRARIWLMKDGVLTWPTPSTMTDDRGSYTLEMLDPGPYTLWVRRDSSVAHREDIWIEGEQELVVEIQSVRLSGVVTRTDGEPILGARIVLVPRVEIRDPLDNLGGTAVTDADGRYELRVVSLAAGVFDVRVEAAGHATEIRSVDLRGVDRLDVVMERRGARVAIRWAGRTAPSDASVTLLDSAGRVVRRLDNAAGSGWVVEDVPSEAVSAVVSSGLVVAAGPIPALEQGSGTGEQGPIPVVIDWPATGAVRLLGESLVPPVAEMMIRVRDAAGRVVPGPGPAGLSEFRPISLFGEPIVGLPVGVWTLERIERREVAGTARVEVVEGVLVDAVFR